MERTHIHLVEMANADQIANLQKLYAYLKEKGDNNHFNMGTYFVNLEEEVYTKHGPSDQSTQQHSCGTVACLAGHGPMAGIPAQRFQNWFPYVAVNFAPGLPYNSSLHEEFGGVNNPIFTWLFSGDWEVTDNTLEGALKRLEIALTNGIPLNAEKQLDGKIPLEYSLE